MNPEPMFSLSPPEEPSAFDRFWKAWPRHFRKAAKNKCQARWKRDKLDAKADHVLAVLESWKVRWLKDGNKYVPAPLVWLNGQRWDADIEDIAPKRDTTPHPLTREIIQKSDVRYCDPQDRQRAVEMRKVASKADQIAMVRWAQAQTGRTSMGVFAAYLTRARYEREKRV